MPDAWRSLPVIQRTVTGDPLLNPADRFTGSLAAWRNPSYLAPLGHATGPDEPAGLLSGLVTPAPVEAVPPEHADPPGSAEPVPDWSAATGREPAGPLAAPAVQPASVRPFTVNRLVTAPPVPVVLRLPTIDAPAPALAGPASEPPAPSPDRVPTLGTDLSVSTMAESPATSASPNPATGQAPADPGTGGPSADPAGSPPQTSAPTRRLGLGEPIVPPLAVAPPEPGWPAGPLPVSRLTGPSAGAAIPDAPTGRPAPPSTSNPVGYAHPPARPTPTGPARPADLTDGPGGTVEPAHRDGPDLPLAPPALTVARSVGAAPDDLPGTAPSPGDPSPTDPSPADPPVGASAGPELTPTDQDGWSADADTRPTIGTEPAPLASVDWSTDGSPNGPDRPHAGDGLGDGVPMSPLLGAAPLVGGAPAGTDSLGAAVDATAGASAGVTVARTATGSQSLGATTDGQSLGATTGSQSPGVTAGDPATGPGAGLSPPAQRMTAPDRPRPGGTGAAAPIVVAPIVVARLIGDRPPVTRLRHPADRRPAGPAVQRLTWDRPTDGGGGATDFITATDSPNQPDINGRHDVFGTASRAVATQVGVVGTPAEAGDPLAASWPAGGNRPARSSIPATVDGFGPVTAGPVVSAVDRAPALTVARSTAEAAGNPASNPAGGSAGGPTGSAGHGGAAFGVPLAFSWVGSMDAAADRPPEPARTVQRADEPAPPEAPPGPVELSTGPQPEPPPASTGDVPQSVAPTSAGAAAAPGGAAVEPEELLKKLFDPLLRKIKTELRLDRERHGLPGGVG